MGYFVLWESPPRRCGDGSSLPLLGGAAEQLTTKCVTDV